jgi:hypothetical protein
MIERIDPRRHGAAPAGFNHGFDGCARSGEHRLD